MASRWAVRLAWADYWFRTQSVEGIEKAIGVTPGRADYHARLAALVSQTNAKVAADALQHAVSLNPYDARSWIELGLHYEKYGNLPLAEQCLLRAAGEDQQYLPRWTLVNYYFRRRAMDRFWVWARAAAAIIHDEPAPLFQLCGRVTEDGNLIDRLNIVRPDLRAAYLSYLVSQNRLDLIRPTSRYLLKGGRPSDIPLLLTTCDRLLDANHGDDALEIWNSLAGNRSIPFGRLRPDEGPALTNGEFRHTPISQGFDWRLATVEGVSTAIEQGGGLRLSFSGTQPEECELLVQFVPTRENSRYEVAVDYGGSGMGLWWRIQDLQGNRLLVDGHSPVGKVSFTTPAGSRITRLSLVYSRASGTTRMEGSVVLRSVELKRQ